MRQRRLILMNTGFGYRQEALSARWRSARFFQSRNRASSPAMREEPAKLSHSPVSPSCQNAMTKRTGNSKAMDKEIMEAGRAFPTASR